MSLRKQRAIGRQELARLAQVSRSGIIAIEHDRSASMSVIDRILSVLGAGPRLEPIGQEQSFCSTVSTSSVFHGWETPLWGIERLHSVFKRFDLDPGSPSKDRRRCRLRARVRFTIDDEALLLPWLGNVFVNPLYGRDLGVCTTKARSDSESGTVESIGPVPPRTDTNWWHRNIILFATVLFFKGRLRFGGGKQSVTLIPSALA